MGNGYPSLKCFVLSLNSLQNLAELIPFDPSCGPRGGLGKAWRVGICILNFRLFDASLGYKVFDLATAFPTFDI